MKIGKKKLLCLFLFAVIFVSLFLDFSLFLFIFLVYLCGLFGILVLGLVNKFVKHTNWYKNIFIYTKQFVSNIGYRDNIIRNYDVVNLGSNPALFAFFYDGVKGANWATGSQGPDMDFEILRYYHSYIKSGGTVIIPIMPFTSISLYLRKKTAYWGKTYYAKFASILDYSQIRGNKDLREGAFFFRFPLLSDPKNSLLKIIKDEPKDCRFLLSEQPMMTLDLKQDAVQCIRGWIKEFDLQSLDAPISGELRACFDKAVELVRNMIDFCLARNLKPALVCPPMTRHLAGKFSSTARKQFISDFVEKCNTADIPFFDYTDCPDFQSDDLYFNSFFLNLRGRKFFTKRVLQDLNVMAELKGGGK